VALLLGACASDDDGESNGSGEDVRVGLAFDIGGRGDRSFNASAAAGIERARDELGIEFQELSPNPDGSNRGELLRELADGGYDPIFGIGYAFFEEEYARTISTLPSVETPSMTMSSRPA
jgi:basic membrane protein A